ncbi:unnamed protein product [Protopolystoma xenopodis]|uniref:Uncharacterized protein n=1 Tax=Protopolystoma xenopodis TaxID=117903 RepID=A0A3S5B5V2_9PLAT|nr:unnamed protein product [Protopolystoma xenopodis]
MPSEIVCQPNVQEDWSQPNQWNRLEASHAFGADEEEMIVTRQELADSPKPDCETNLSNTSDTSMLARLKHVRQRRSRKKQKTHLPMQFSVDITSSLRLNRPHDAKMKSAGDEEQPSPLADSDSLVLTEEDTTIITVESLLPYI